MANPVVAKTLHLVTPKKFGKSDRYLSEVPLFQETVYDNMLLPFKFIQIYLTVEA